jgi:hypothetical protein
MIDNSYQHPFARMLFIYRAAEGDKDIQIRQRSQDGSPSKGLPSDLFTKDNLAAGGPKSQLGQSVHRIPQSCGNCRILTSEKTQIPFMGDRSVSVLPPA